MVPDKNFLTHIRLSHITQIESEPLNSIALSAEVPEVRPIGGEVEHLRTCRA